MNKKNVILSRLHFKWNYTFEDPENNIKRKYIQYGLWLPFFDSPSIKLWKKELDP